MKLNDLIKSRRAIFPDAYNPEKSLNQEVIQQLLEAAIWAPSHKLSQPWRFYIFHDSQARHRLGEHLAQAYKIASQTNFSDLKYQKFFSRVSRSGCVIALGMLPSADLPEWEEVAAVACAVQNMWLTCTDLGLGCYWSTPGFFLESAGSFLPMQDQEKCLGLFYVGYPEKLPPATQRKSWEQVSIWM